MIETRFKQTEIGLIPEDWEIQPIRISCYIIGNNTCSRDMLSDYGHVMNIHYGDILIKLGSVTHIDATPLPYIKPNIRKEAKIKLSNGDVVIADTAEDNTVGKATEIQGLNENSQIEAGLHTVVIRPKEKFHPSFLGYYVNSHVYHNQLLPHIQGIKVASISKQTIKNTFLLKPASTTEQQRIATALSDIDALIASLGKLIAKKEAIKQGVMQQLLTGKKRLKGFNDAWIEKSLGEIGQLSMCKRIFQQQTTPTGDIPFYKIGTFGAVPDSYISKEVYEEYKNKYRYPTKGDILLSAAGTIGRTVVFDGKPAYFQDSNIIWLKHDNSVIINPYLYYVYQLIHWNIENTTIQRLYNDNFNNTNILIPPTIAEQRAIAAILTDMDKEIAALQAKKAKYEHLKQGMMQQLLTGRIRLVRPKE